MTHECHDYFEEEGIWGISDGTVTFYGKCNQCFRKLRAVFDYRKLIDDETDETLHSVEGEV